jgi:hypothetical protein
MKNIKLVFVQNSVSVSQKTEELDNFSKKEQKNEIQCRKI